MDSAWIPCGFHMDSISIPWIPCGIRGHGKVLAILFISPCERRVDDPWVWFFVQKKMYIV